MLNAIKAIEDIPAFDRRDAAALTDQIIYDVIAALQRAGGRFIQVLHRVGIDPSQSPRADCGADRPRNYRMRQFVGGVARN